MTTTFEEAKLCPKCELPGEDVGTVPARNSEGQAVQIHTIFCRNDKCAWYNTNYLVQVNPDGSVPEAYSQLGEKKYPKISQESATRIEDAIKYQLEHETEPGLEIRNPKGN